MASNGTLGAYFGQYFHQYDTSLLSNHGLLAAINDVKLRQGSILQPNWPAALGCRAHTFAKLKSSVRALLAEATGGNVMAGSAVYVIAYWRMKESGTGDWLLCTDGIAVGHGARPFADGLDAIYSRHNENYPGEFMEMEYPLRMERYAIAIDSGGPGKLRGGCGIIRDVRILAVEGTFGLRVENNIFPTWGVAGGMGGGTSLVVMNPGTPHEKKSGRSPMITCGTRATWCGYTRLAVVAGRPLGAGSGKGARRCARRVRQRRGSPALLRCGH